LLNELVFDSSSIISVSQNCLMNILGNLSKKTKNEFRISKAVEFESVSKPLDINRFELNALRIKRAVDLGWLKVEEQEVDLTEIDELANNIFFIGNKPIKVIHAGEAETIALYKKINASVMVIDERTTRMLIEEPDNLVKKLRANYRKNIKVNKNSLNNFLSFVGRIKIVRSAELLAEAFELGCFEGELENSVKALEAALYGLKFNGCAVSLDEIKEYVSVL